MTALPARFDLLIVEDSPTDALIASEAFARSTVITSIEVVEDGEEAIEFLHQRGPFAQARRPHLILLDLNLPRKSGHEVLAEIKADANLQSIPVVVLTTSGSAGDVGEAYRLHANAYLTKPVSFDAFAGVAQAVERFWGVVATFPGSRERLRPGDV